MHSAACSLLLDTSGPEEEHAKAWRDRERRAERKTEKKLGGKTRDWEQQKWPVGRRVTLFGGPKVRMDTLGHHTHLAAACCRSQCTVLLIEFRQPGADLSPSLAYGKQTHAKDKAQSANSNGPPPGELPIDRRPPLFCQGHSLGHSRGHSLALVSPGSLLVGVPHETSRLPPSRRTHIGPRSADRPSSQAKRRPQQSSPKGPLTRAFGSTRPLAVE